MSFRAIRAMQQVTLAGDFNFGRLTKKMPIISNKLPSATRRSIFLKLIFFKPHKFYIQAI